MGGFLGSSPSLPPVAEPEPTPDPDEEERERRLERLERMRRGRSGLITTSRRGLLDEQDNTAANSTATLKTKLGE
tara:strand:+ start:701 stop:925 length:225 start_codon:yes stop_codon:yes gene_type:complete